MTKLSLCGGAVVPSLLLSVESVEAVTPCLSHARHNVFLNHRQKPYLRRLVRFSKILPLVCVWLLLLSVYYDGWRPSETPTRVHVAYYMDTTKSPYGSVALCVCVFKTLDASFRVQFRTFLLITFSEEDFTQANPLGSSFEQNLRHRQNCRMVESRVGRLVVVVVVVVVGREGPHSSSDFFHIILHYLITNSIVGWRKGGIHVASEKIPFGLKSGFWWTNIPTDWWYILSQKQA